MEYNVDKLRGSILDEDNVLYIQNKYIKLGLNLELGGAITYFAEHGKNNMINSQDWGRQVQLSFYGGPRPYCPEGVEMQEKWKHCGWNPIQSGDWFFNRSKVVDYHAEEGKAYIKCIPMQWALNNCPGECTFELWFTLVGKTVNVQVRLNNDRPDTTWYGAFGQELPAVYSNGEWFRAFAYVGKEPFTGGPVTEIIGRETEEPWPVRGVIPTENWLALVDDREYGFGIYEPLTNQFATGFSGGHERMGWGGPKDGQTGYIGPSLSEILDHNIVYEFRYSLIAGTVEEIRAEACRMEAESGYQARKHYCFSENRDHFYYRGIQDKGFGNQNCLDFDFEEGNALCAPAVFVAKKDCGRILLDAAFDGGEIHGKVQVSLYDGEVMRVHQMEKKTVDFVLCGDGVRRVHEINLSGIDDCFVGAELIFGSTGHAKIYAFDFAK